MDDDDPTGEPQLHAMCKKGVGIGDALNRPQTQIACGRGGVPSRKN